MVLGSTKLAKIDFLGAQLSPKQCKRKAPKMKPSNTILNTSQSNSVDDYDDEPDEWDKRIIDTGCHQENLNLQLCHADTGDWRKCLKEMQAFRLCWEKNKNNERTSTVDNSEVK